MNEFEALQRALDMWTCDKCGHEWREHAGESGLCVGPRDFEEQSGQWECGCEFEPADQSVPNPWCLGPVMRILPPAKAQFAVRRTIVMAEISCPDHGVIGSVPLIGNEPNVILASEIYRRHMATERFNRAQVASEAAALDLLAAHDRQASIPKEGSDGAQQLRMGGDLGRLG